MDETIAEPADRLLELADIALAVPESGGGVRTLFKDLSFNVPRRSITGLIGPNGSGKSTLLNFILGEVCQLRGNINYPEGSLRKALVPQDYRGALFPWLSVSGNIDLYASGSMIIDRTFLADCLSSFGIDKLLNQPLSWLSGGEQQLLINSILLASQTDLLLLDEPFSAVDLVRKRKIKDTLVKRVQHLSFGCIFITHDIREAAELSSQIIILPGAAQSAQTLVRRSSDTQSLWLSRIENEIYF